MVKKKLVMLAATLALIAMFLLPSVTLAATQQSLGRGGHGWDHGRKGGGWHHRHHRHHDRDKDDHDCDDDGCNVNIRINVENTKGKDDHGRFYDDGPGPDGYDD